MVDRQVRVRFTGDVTGYLRALRAARRENKRTRTSLGGLQRAVVAIGALTIGRKLLRGVRNVTAAYEVQEDAVNNLRAALDTAGTAGQESLDRLTASAARLQQITTKGDEAIIAATASLRLLATELAPEDLERAQRAFIGIADTFLKGDVNNAALLLGKTLGSTTNALTRYGIEIDTTASQSEKLRQVVAQTEGLFAVSIASVNTLAGAQAQLSNSFGDLREVFGEIVAKSFNLQSATGGLRGVIEDFTESLQRNQDAIIEWARATGGAIRSVAEAAANLAKEVGRRVGATDTPFMAMLRTDIELQPTPVALANLREEFKLRMIEIQDIIDQESEKADIKITVPSLRPGGGGVRAGIQTGPPFLSNRRINIAFMQGQLKDLDEAIELASSKLANFATTGDAVATSSNKVGSALEGVRVALAGVADETTGLIHDFRTMLDIQGRLGRTPGFTMGAGFRFFGPNAPQRDVTIPPVRGPMPVGIDTRNIEEVDALTPVLEQMAEGAARAREAQERLQQSMARVADVVSDVIAQLTGLSAAFVSLIRAILAEVARGISGRGGIFGFLAGAAASGLAGAAGGGGPSVVGVGHGGIPIFGGNVVPSTSIQPVIHLNIETTDVQTFSDKVGEVKGSVADAVALGVQRSLVMAKALGAR